MGSCLPRPPGWEWKGNGVADWEGRGEKHGVQDCSACEEVLRRLHESGFVHGDLNRYNFLVNEEIREEEVEATLISFENAAVYDERVASRELEGLEEQLREETRRGGPAIPM